MNEGITRLDNVTKFFCEKFYPCQTVEEKLEKFSSYIQDDFVEFCHFVTFCDLFDRRSEVFNLLTKFYLHARDIQYFKDFYVRAMDDAYKNPATSLLKVDPDTMDILRNRVFAVLNSYGIPTQ